MASAEWTQPTYKEVMELWRTRSDAGWGHPVGRGNARHWSDCEAIDTAALGDGVKERVQCVDPASASIRLGE